MRRALCAMFLLFALARSAAAQTLVGCTTASNQGNESSQTIAFPGSLAAGDGMVAFVIVSDTPLPVASASGWTTPSGATVTFSNASDTAFTKIATSGDVGTGSVTFNFSQTSSTTLISLCAYSGTNATTLADGTGAAAENFSTSVSIPSWTTSVNGDMLVAGYWNGSASATWTGPSGWGSSIWNDNSLSLRHTGFNKIQSSAGATGILTGTQSGSSAFLFAVAVALRPGSGGLPTPTPTPTGPTPTPTLTPTPTQTPTLTPTPSQTPTPTLTPTPTGTPTQTPTGTPTPTPLPTPSLVNVSGRLFDQYGTPAANVEVDLTPVGSTLSSPPNALPAGIRTFSNYAGAFSMSSVGNVIAALYIPSYGSLYRVALPASGAVTLSNLINSPQTIVTGFPPQTDLNMGFHRLTNVGTDIAAADALSRGQSTTQSLADWSQVDPTQGQYALWSGSSWGGGSIPGFVSWDGALGSFTSAALSPAVAGCTGHFTQLTCSATLTGTCTTGPTINVADVTASTVGIAVSPTTTVGTLAQAEEILGFSAGETIALEQTATTGTCTVPTYSCMASYACP